MLTFMLTLWIISIMLALMLTLCTQKERFLMSTFSPKVQKQIDTVVEKFYKEGMSVYTASQWLCQISSKFDKQSAAMQYLYDHDPEGSQHGKENPAL